MAKPKLSARERRLLARIPLMLVAAKAGVSEATAKIFELDPTRLRPDKRALLEAVYAALPSKPPKPAAAWSALPSVHAKGW